MKAYWHLSNNFGDTLTPIILSHFLGVPVTMARRKSKGKFIGIGSILTALRENDVVWGSGLIRDVPRPMNKGVKLLAVRGPLTLKHLGGKEPMVYGDPALLLPLIYNPDVKKKHKVGVIPHSVETDVLAKEGQHRIDINADWKTVIEEVKSCETIVSSALHGIICAEAYGIPVTWAKFSDKIIGGEFKFQDYFLGTGRKKQKYWNEIPPIQNLEKRQQDLLKVLRRHFKR